ncbi:MAG: serine hydrolase [Erythrobacter sp.]
MVLLRLKLCSAFLALTWFAALVWIVQAPPVQAQALPQYDLAALEKAISAGELGKIRAVAAEQYGKTIYRKRFGSGELGDRVDIKSAGKSITALAIGMAIDDGKLASVDTPVWPYLDSTRPEPWASITVADLLSMSSALDCNDWDKKSPGQEERMYRKRSWRAFALALPAREYGRDRGGNGPFSYCTAGVFLLGQVVQKATGERFDEYVQRRLFDPLSIDGAQWRKSRSGEIQSGGQLTISDAALLKIGRLVLNRGEWNGERIISEGWLKAMVKPQHQLGEHVHYARLWWLTPLQSSRGFEGALMMKGNGGNIVALVPSMDAVLVVQAENYNKGYAEKHAFTVLTTLLRSMPVPSQDL